MSPYVTSIFQVLGSSWICSRAVQLQVALLGAKGIYHGQSTAYLEGGASNTAMFNERYHHLVPRIKSTMNSIGYHYIFIFHYLHDIPVLDIILFGSISIFSDDLYSLHAQKNELVGKT